jgi:predicted adenylyl cyclase CyaB
MGENKFEIEVRALVNEDFKEKMISKGAETSETDTYQDDYYKPTSPDWDPEIITMRLRKGSGKDFVEILFSKVNYMEKGGVRIKRSLYPQGKIRIFSGKEKIAKQLLKDCGFEYWFTVKKLSCSVIKFENIEFALENVEDLGWTIEIESDGTNPESAIIDLWNKLEKLGIRKKQLINTSLPKAVAVKKGLI